MITVETENGITFNQAGTALSWRLIYATGATTAILFEAVGKTGTIHNIEEFSTEQEGTNRAAALGVTLPAKPVKHSKPL